jgi:Lrp/AsnC family transcriptional regulator for asnA, asnC and gidA
VITTYILRDVTTLNTKIDKVDLNILSFLQENARTPFTKIAEKLGVSDATIHLRVRKLEELGVIENYTIIINEKEIGKPITTYILIRVDPGTVEDVCRKLMELNDVYEICEIHERYDILVKIRGHSLDEVRNIIINKIRSISDIVGSEAYTIYKTWKQDLGIQMETLPPHHLTP